MDNSRYQQRARAIHGERYATKPVPTDITKECYWNQYVKSKDDVRAFYKLYYPYLPEVLVDATVLHIERIINGEIKSSEQFYKHSETNKKLQDKIWDFKADIEAHKLDGKIKIAEERMRKLFDEEE